MSQRKHDSTFTLVEKDGWSKREVFESDDLKEFAEFLAEKSGTFDVEFRGER